MAINPFERHSLVMVPFHFTARATQKRRPAVVLAVVLAMVTTAKQSAGLPQPCLVSLK
jgi:hypothetical protein